jgi:CelD/BcsL family acetyltransferase involved in cellulose biosynthesis
MSELRIADNTSRGDWESFLAKSISGNLQQSFDYGDVMKMSNQNNRVIRLSVSDGDSFVGLVQAIFPRKRLGFGASLYSGGVYGFGSVVSIKDKEYVLRDLLSSLERSAVNNRVTEGFISRPESDRVLESTGYAISEVANFYEVGLHKRAEELWKSIAHNKRRNVKKAQEQRAEVVQLKSYDALVSFYDMYKASSERVGFEAYPFNYFYSYLRVFGVRDKVRVFLTVLNDQPVAGVFLVVHGDTAYALAAGSRKDVWHVRPNDLLHWKAMEWACGEGLSWYHMGHVYDPVPTENSPGWSLWRWKREWNGQLKKYYTYHKIYMPRLKKFVLTPLGKIYNKMQ